MVQKLNEPAKPRKPVVNHRDWALDNFAAAMKIPVFSGLPIGHGDLQWPLPLGVAAELKLDSQWSGQQPRLGDPCFSLRVAIPDRGMSHEASRVGKWASGMPQTPTLSCPMAHASDGWSLE